MSLWCIQVLRPYLWKVSNIVLEFQLASRLTSQIIICVLMQWQKHCFALKLGGVHYFAHWAIATLPEGRLHTEIKTFLYGAYEWSFVHIYVMSNQAQLLWTTNFVLLFQLWLSCQQQNYQELQISESKGWRACVHHVPQSNHELSGTGCTDLIDHKNLRDIWPDCT